MNIPAFLNTLTNTARTLPIVIFYVTAQCNLRCITCSYREALPNELSLDEITSLAGHLRRLGLRHIVYSGGEPLVRRDFREICEVFRNIGVKQSLLTNGLLLYKRADEIAGYFTEIIVSVDGADAETHNAVRGVESFDTILKGIVPVVQSGANVSIRTVLQRRNFRQVEAMVNLARSLGAQRISFLAADVQSSAFGRDVHEPAAKDDEVLLTKEETLEFRRIVGEVVSSHADWFRTGFISQSPEGMFHIVQYYEAMAGQGSFPRNTCNAPMVSAVIASNGDLLPCFFLPAFGNIRSNPLDRLLNNMQIRSVRRNVRRYTLERCRKCVCTLHVQPHAALFDLFP
jgi:MoaA/NifB/PqqE/SkfB family radical SAM enzyme